LPVADRGLRAGAASITVPSSATDATTIPSGIQEPCLKLRSISQMAIHARIEAPAHLNPIKRRFDGIRDEGSPSTTIRHGTIVTNASACRIGAVQTPRISGSTSTPTKVKNATHTIA